MSDSKIAHDDEWLDDWTSCLVSTAMDYTPPEARPRVNEIMWRLAKRYHEHMQRWLPYSDELPAGWYQVAMERNKYSEMDDEKIIGREIFQRVMQKNHNGCWSIQYEMFYGAWDVEYLAYKSIIIGPPPDPEQLK